MEASGKHRHGFIREVFDSGRPRRSENIQNEPDVINRGLVIKYNLQGYYGTPLMDAAFKYGLVSFYKHKPGLFDAFEITKFLAVMHRIVTLVTKARAGEQGRG